jgi:hypothetical protein
MGGRERKFSGGGLHWHKYNVCTGKNPSDQWTINNKGQEWKIGHIKRKVLTGAGG